MASSTSGYASVFGGYTNVSSGKYAVVSGGALNTASGMGSAILGGQTNTASAINAVVCGGTNAVADKFAKSAFSSGKFAANGDAQTGRMVLLQMTTDATPVVLTSGATAASSVNQVVLPNDSTYIFRGQVVARNSGNDADSKCWEFKGAIRRGTSAATTALIGAPTIDLIASDGSAWIVALTADTTNGGLKIEVTGEAAKLIRWVATVWTTEVTG